jgi:hypothetical protein
MTDTRTVLAQRGALEPMAARDGVSLPDDMRHLFEAGQLVDASARAEAERNALLTIAGAAAARSADSDPLTTIGMLGEHPEADLSDARAALATGDLDATLASAGDAFRAWNGAWQEGRRRALLLVAVLATILVLGSAVAGRARTARRGTAVPVSGGPTLALAGYQPGHDPFEYEPTVEELMAAATPPVPTVELPVPAGPAAGPATVPPASGGDGA